MENIEGIYYYEVKNLDDFPKCSKCQVPITNCKHQCEKYGEDFYFKMCNTQDVYVGDGCMMPLTYGAIIFLLLTILFTNI